METHAHSNPSSNARMPRRMVWLALLLLLIGALVGGIAARWLMPKPGGAPAPAAPEKQVLYQCPMHPSITSDHPGDCPICGMKLVEVKPDESANGQAERKIKFYRSPMDPKQTSPGPRKDEMGMDYLPVYADEEAEGGGNVPGLTTVTIDPARQQLIGLRTAPVTRGPIAGSWRTVGRVEVDPTRVRKVSVKVEGYIERTSVDSVGRPVRKGEPLFSMYSPALLAAENEYVIALQMQGALASGALAGNGDSLVASARRKLELWDVPAPEIERIARTRQASRSLTFVSPIAGVVTAKNVVDGTRVNPGDTPYEITDLSAVWVMADAYESDLAQVKVGMPATLTVQAYPSQPFQGKVEFIEPLLDPQSRTAKVHMHFMNPGLLLKPEMFGSVVLEGVPREGLRIPADAVIHSGTQDVVFLSLGNGKFEPRAVQLGAKSGDQIEVMSGLTPGEEVVLRANFLVDSESQLRSSLSAMGGK